MKTVNEEEGWKTVGHVPIKLKVDEDGNSTTAMFLCSAMADGTFTTGEKFIVGSTGELVIVYVGDNTYKVSMRHLVTEIEKLFSSKKED